MILLDEQVHYPAQKGPTKADTIHLLSSLAPSLLLSSLLLPLALAYLTNATGANTGRKRRDLLDFEKDEGFQTPIILDDQDNLDYDAKIETSDPQLVPVIDAVLDFALNDTNVLTRFVHERVLSDSGNTCLEKMACLATTVQSNFKRFDSLKKYFFTS